MSVSKAQQAKGDCWFGRELLNEVCASVDEEWT